MGSAHPRRGFAPDPETGTGAVTYAMISGPAMVSASGVVVALRRKDFLGVLRPEYADNIDFDALKREYTEQHAEVGENGFDGFEADEDDWEVEV